MPFFIEMSQKKILIIGGGYKGLKRVEKYLKTGAEIIVYSKSFDEKLIELADGNQVKLVKGDVEDYERLEELIEESDIVMVALEKKDYNEKIKKITKKYRRLLNLANDAEETDLVVPIDSTVGPLRIAITTEGKSSIIAREALHKIVKLLEEDIELREFTELMYSVKKIVKKTHFDSKKKLEIYYKIYNNSLLREAIKIGDYGKAREIVFNILREEGLRVEEGEL